MSPFLPFLLALPLVYTQVRINDFDSFLAMYADPENAKLFIKQARVPCNSELYITLNNQATYTWTAANMPALQCRKRNKRRSASMK